MSSSLYVCVWLNAQSKRIPLTGRLIQEDSTHDFTGEYEELQTFFNLNWRINCPKEQLQANTINSFLILLRSFSIQAEIINGFNLF